MESLGDRKLIVYAYYQKAILALTEHGQQYGAVAVNGAMTSTQRERNIERFMTDPSCRLLIVQPLSMGSGRSEERVLGRIVSGTADSG